MLVKTLPSQACYPSVARNNIRSRAWAAPVSGCSFAVERAWLVLRSGQTLDLAPNLGGLPAPAPTFAPAHYERIHTRASGGHARNRAVQEVSIVFNLVHEPWVKYTLGAIADRGLRRHEWTSALMIGTTLYLESHRLVDVGWRVGTVFIYSSLAIDPLAMCQESGYLVGGPSILDSGHAFPMTMRLHTCVMCQCVVRRSSSSQTIASRIIHTSRSHRFELTRVPSVVEEAAAAETDALPAESQKEPAAPAPEDRYRFSRCAAPEPWQRMKALGVPLPDDHVTVLYPDLTWEELRWAQQGVHIRDRFFQLVRLRFVPNAAPVAS